VPSIPLIASSIMSKKLAEGLDGLVLDVKVGRGAFMKDLDGAHRLARLMAGIGATHGTTVVAIPTNMDQPLGRAVGNANEMVESLEVLEGNGPADLIDVVYRLGEEMLVIAGVTADRTAARTRLREAVESGAALEKLIEVVEAQDGDPTPLREPDRFPVADHHYDVTAGSAGFVTRADALDIGVGALRLGAGRERKEDGIDPAVGVLVEVKVGDRVEHGSVLARIAWNERRRFEAALPLVEGAFTIGDTAPEPLTLVYEEVT
jgi:pyrimidine-nucleoside phosphorylase/thymidine phosphorylase